MIKILNFSGHPLEPPQGPQGVPAPQVENHWPKCFALDDKPYS